MRFFENQNVSYFGDLSKSPVTNMFEISALGLIFRALVVYYVADSTGLHSVFWSTTLSGLYSLVEFR